MGDERRLPGTVAKIAASPEGAKVGAFFDLDGTLIAGYSARYFAEERFKRREVSATELARTLGMVATGGLGGSTVTGLIELSAEGWRGRTLEDVDELGLRLFEKKIADRLFPEMREIVLAHQQRGHTVVLSSSATSPQVQPVADYLGIDHVICNRYTTDDGVLTGAMDQPVIWGEGKADAVQRFAADRGIDLADCYFYADGDEDLALMYLVGNPRPTNPGGALGKVATKRGWPILRMTSRGAGSMLSTVAALGSLVPIAGLGVSLGLVTGDKRAALNFVSEHWVEMMFAVNGVHLNIVGQQHAEAARPAVFIFNHRNGFDPFMATAVVKRDFTAVAKGELRSDPIVGTFGRFMEIAFIDRGDTTASVDALKAIEQLAAKGLSVLVSPEGTRLDTTGVGPFKKGAFRIAMAAGIPVVPIVIRNAELIGGNKATSMNPGTVDVAVLPAISVDDWTLDDLPERIEGVRRQFLDTLADWPG